MPAKVLEADYYFLCPIHIQDWSLFERNLSQSMWQVDSRYRSYSIKPILAAFLGKSQSEEFPIAPGLSFLGNLQKSDNPKISSLNKPVSFIDKKGTAIEGIGGLLTFDSMAGLIVSPNRKGAVIYLKMYGSPNTLDEVEESVYVLHKTDHNQAPYINSAGGSNSTSLTLRNIIDCILPYNGYSVESESRFISSVYARVDGSTTDFSIDVVKDSLVRLSLSKNKQYKITASDKAKVFIPFDNVLTCGTREGFAGIVVSRTPNQESDFFKNFGNTFQMSYLPLYLATILVDQTYVNALRNIDSVATDLFEQDCLRQARLIITLTPSQYEHLNKQMLNLLDGMEFEQKYQVIKDSLLARKEQIEFERLQLEKERKEVEAKEQEQHRLAEEERKTQLEARDRRINLLLGFIGVGQVVFAILQLLGSNNILGDLFSQSLTLNIITGVVSAFFIGMIFYLIFKLFKERKK